MFDFKSVWTIPVVLYCACHPLAYQKMAVSKLNWCSVQFVFNSDFLRTQNKMISAQTCAEQMRQMCVGCTVKLY